MATFDIVLAKKYFRQLDNDSNKPADYTTYLTNAIEPAKNYLTGKDGIGEDNYLNFANTNLDIDIKSDAAASSTSHSFNFDNTLTTIKVGDMLILSASTRKVIAVEDSSTTGEGTVTFQGAYSGSDTTFRLKSMEAIYSMYSWLVVYYFFDTAHDLLIGEILTDSKQFGDGNISPERQLENKRNQLLNNANMDKSTVNKLITIPVDFSTSIPIRL